LNGVTFFIHRNPPKGYLGVRVRYGATALIGRSLYEVHAAVLQFLLALGCTVTKETVSRVDMQITVSMDIDELFIPIKSGHAVCRAHKDVFHRDFGRCETYTIGRRGRLQGCAYDKTSEMKVMAVSNPAKFQLMVDEHLGPEYSFETPLVRVEFRFWRDMLHLLEVNTVEDLRQAETDIAHWLTSNWFRILDVPKDTVEGRENRAEVAPIWCHIQALFLRFFPGVGKPVEKITLRRDKPVTCEPTALLKQAGGCLKTAMALMFGVDPFPESVSRMLTLLIDSMKDDVYKGMRERATKLQVVTGLSVERMSDCRRDVREWLRELRVVGGRCYG
jgi:hypothetical protein